MGDNREGCERYQPSCWSDPLGWTAVVRLRRAVLGVGLGIPAGTLRERSEKCRARCIILFGTAIVERKLKSDEKVRNIINSYVREPNKCVFNIPSSFPGMRGPWVAAVPFAPIIFQNEASGHPSASFSEARPFR